MRIYRLRFTVFRRRQPLTAESVQDLVHRLWRHGLRYSEEPTSEPLWEAQLEAIGECYAEGQFHALSLTEASQLIARSKDGILTVYDHTLGLQLRIWDPPVTQDAAPFDTLHYERLHLWLKRDLAPRKADDGAPTSALLWPLQQEGMVFAHWCRVFAEEAQALFACGYDSETDNIFSTVRTWAASVLESGHLVVPSWSVMWYHEATALVSDTLQEALSQPGALVQRAEQGGWWGLSPRWASLSQEAITIHEEQDKGTTCEIAVLRSITDPEKRSNYALMALRHYERALEIARAAHYESGEWGSMFRVTHMTQFIADLERPPSAADAEHRARMESIRAKFDQLQRERRENPDDSSQQ